MDLEIPRFTPSIFDIFATPAYAQGSFSPENNAAAQASSNAATLATMDGYAANFDLIHNLQIGSSFATTQLTAAVKTLAAQMRFSWKIGKDSPGGFAKEDRIKLPRAVFDSASQYVAGLPLTLEVSSAPIIHPAITGGKQFATGAFTVTYNGSTIDTVNNGSGGASGDLSASATLDQDTGISAAAPVGMQVAYREADCQSSLPGNQPLKLPVGSPPEYVLIP